TSLAHATPRTCACCAALPAPIGGAQAAVRPQTSVVAIELLRARAGACQDGLSGFRQSANARSGGFFLGGVFWGFAYFATKQQLKEVQCIMNAKMAFVQ